MRIIEYRIILPIKYEQFSLAEDYMVAKRTLDECSGGEGIEIVKREDWESKYGIGIYAHKVYHYRSRVPLLLRWMVPESLTDFHEESWTCFPYSLCRYKVEYLADKFTCEVDSHSYPFTSIQDIVNPSELTEEELAIREVRYLDIVSTPPLPTRDDWKLAGFSCPSAGINEIPQPTRPFDFSQPPEWIENYKGPMMYAAKCVKVNVNIWGLQTRAENLIAESVVESILIDSARGITGWAPEWSLLDRNAVDDFTLKAFNKVNEMIKQAEEQAQEGQTTNIADSELLEKQKELELEQDKFVTDINKPPSMINDEGQVHFEMPTAA